jgi:hypothetical protein
MTAKKISQLAAAANAADTDQFPVNQGGTTKRVTRSQVLARKVTGTVASPVELSTVTVPITANKIFELIICRGDSAPLNAGGVPQIQAGTVIGQALTFRGTDNTNTFTLGLGGSDGVELNGPCTLRNGSVLELIWDGTLWIEVSRNDI